MARRSDPHGQEVDELYGLPPSDFTGARNALAKRLREKGNPEQAQEVKALRKPSLPAWAINQGVRADAGAAERLLDAGEGLRKASGGDELRTAMREEAAAVEEMTTAAAKAAASEALSVGMVNRVRETLRAVAGDDDLRGEFEAGRVQRDRKAVGLGGGLALGESGPRGKAKARPSAADRRTAEAAVKRARKALDARRRDLADAQRKAEQARKVYDEADRRLARAQGDVDNAQDELDAAETARDEL